MKALKSLSFVTIMACGICFTALNANAATQSYFENYIVCLCDKIIEKTSLKYLYFS